MNAENKNHFSLIIWIVALIVIGGVIGSLTKPEISAWYSTLNRSPLTPPNYVFPVAWTILYGIIGGCGWAHLARIIISQAKDYKNLICDSAHFKLELDAFVLPLSLNRTFPTSSGRYGYFGRHAHVSSISEGKISIATNDALFIMDFICHLFKFLHMAFHSIISESYGNLRYRCEFRPNRS
jgi:hypothetical protein